MINLFIEPILTKADYQTQIGELKKLIRRQIRLIHDFQENPVSSRLTAIIAQETKTLEAMEFELLNLMNKMKKAPVI